MPKKYGLPYTGSKSKLADRILELIPPADTFFDLFAGGCAVTHAALLSGRYNHVIANDISDIPQVFVNALNGKYDNEDRWISREDFFALKDTDPFVRLVWSFGNNLQDYLYSREIEPFKKALHWAVYYADPQPLKEYGIDATEACKVADRHQRWLAVKHVCEDAQNTPAPVCNTLAVDKLYPILGGGRTDCQHYERTNIVSNPHRGFSLGRLQTYERGSCLPKQSSLIDKLTILQGDYQSVVIPPNSVVYCDPPYKETRGYGERKSTFNHDRFYDWCRSANFPIWVSEYSMPDDFECIAQFRHTATFSPCANKAVSERLFIHKRWLAHIPVIIQKLHKQAI